MKYLVLGSSGQIGSALIRKIRENKSDEVIEFDIELSKNQDLRIQNNPLLENAMKESDFVFFLAFDVGGSRYLKTYQNTYEFISNNTKIISNTFETLKKYNKPFIFASSQMSNMSYSTYGRLKGIGEACTNVLNGLVVKFWNVYGVEYDLNKSHVITDLIIKAKTTGKIDLLTDGTEERQFLYADDCCECLIELSKKYKDVPRYKELHITSFKWHSVLEVANIIASHYPKTKIAPSESFDSVQQNKKNEPNEFIFSYWKPKTDLKTGIAKIIEAMEKEPKRFFEKQEEKPILVSTITPCFRMKRYLKKFLEELPYQTFFNKMEVVLDHNEPDEEEIKWVKDFQNKYPGKIKHIVVPKVDPIGTSMNRCIKEASGKYLTIWNVDDLRTPDSIETQCKALETEQADLVFGKYKIVKEFGIKEGNIVDDQITGEELTRSMIIGPFFMFRKTLIEKSGYFDEQLKSGADFDLAIRMAMHGKVIRIDSLLGYYLNEGKGASTRPDSLQALDRTVIELRYGIFDKIDYDLVADTARFNIPFIREFGTWNPIEIYVPNYKDFINERKAKWSQKGKINYIFRKIFFVKEMKKILKKIYKKIIKR